MTTEVARCDEPTNSFARVSYHIPPFALRYGCHMGVATMLKKQLWFVAIAMLLSTAVASALTLPAPAYRVLDLSSFSHQQFSGSSAIDGQAAGSFVLGQYRIACGTVASGCTFQQTHAALINYSLTGVRNVVDLNPRSYRMTIPFFSSTVTGVIAGRQVGFGYVKKPLFQEQAHALMWLGSARSVIDLNPKRYAGSKAFGIEAGRIVGTGFIRDYSADTRGGLVPHAIMWLGSPTAFVDLNPRGYTSSEAFTVAKGFVGGYAVENGVRHAYLWQNGAGRDMHPGAYYDSSSIVGVDGATAVGTANTEYGAHAYLWNNVAANIGVDLHTGGFAQTAALAAGAGKQVGFGEFPATATNAGTFHALVWKGSAGSCIDLHAFLPATFVSSKAIAITAGGTIFGIAEDKSGRMHTVLWIPQR